MATESSAAGALFGRETEIEELRALLAADRRNGSCLVLSGEAGVGKTSLLSVARRVAEEAGRLVLSVSGVEAESLFPFAGLHRLLTPVMATSDALPGPQRSALHTALGIEDGPAPALFLTGLATLTLLTDVAARRPVTVLVDDMHWLDETTQSILAFAARRLGNDPVAMVATIRTAAPHRFVDVPATVRQVPPVDDDAAQQVLEHTGCVLSPSDRVRILDLARGNPLALVELATTWTRSTAPAGSEVGPETLLVPTSERLARSFAGRARELPALSRDLLLVAALTDSDELAEILPATRVLAGRPVEPDAADPAVDAGLVTYDAAHLAFRHPVVRSAIVDGESPGRHQKANLALAAVLDAQPGRQIRFRAAAASGPDEGVAVALTEQAEASLRRGAVLDAVASLERAAQLTPDAQVRGHRLLVAAQHAFGLGLDDRVRRLVREAGSTTLSEPDEARRLWLAEIFEDGDPGNEARVRELCSSATQSAVTGEVDLAMKLLYAAAVRCWWSGAGSAARTTVVEALRAVGPDADPQVAMSLAVADPIWSGTDVAQALTEAPVVETHDADTWRALGQAAWAIGDSVRCVDMLDRAAVAMRVQGRLGVLTHVLAIRANARLTLGEWHQADGDAVEAHRLAQETAQPIWVTGSRSVASMLAGLRGAPGAGPELSLEAERYAHSRGLADQLACVALARAFAHAGMGRHESAYDELRTVFDPTSPYHHEREAIHGLMFLAETAVEVGRTSEARQVLARMEELAAATPSPLLHVHLLYARPVLASPGEAEALFLHALEQDLGRWPWVRARTELAYGSWLRRQRRQVDSRAPLRAAQQKLAGLGAVHWARRAAVELRAAGERPEETPSPVGNLLSPQEVQIARLAAQGLSNREIGEQLFCSARTVGSHLYHIFPKLGVTSRTQLAARLADVS